jgi:hypothetical protein
MTAALRTGSAAVPFRLLSRGQGSLPIVPVIMVVAEWLIVAISALAPALSLFLVLKRWPTDASANQVQDLG